MKITQVDASYIKSLDIKGLSKDNLYRLIRIDDGNYGKTHFAVRIKSSRALKVEELLASADDKNCAFIIVEED